MTINFYLDKKSKKVEKTIFAYIRSIGRGRTIVLHTGERINPKYWDKTRQIVKKSYVGSPELNERLTSIKKEIQKIYRDLLNDNPYATYEDFRNALMKRFKKNEPKLMDFFDVFDLYLETRKNNLAENLMKKFITLKKYLENFAQEKKVRLSFDTINLLFYDRFVTYLQNEKKLSNNTIFKTIGFLKIFLNWATERKINTNLDSSMSMKLDEIEKIDKIVDKYNREEALKARKEFEDELRKNYDLLTQIWREKYGRLSYQKQRVKYISILTKVKQSNSSKKDGVILYIPNPISKNGKDSVPIQPFDISRHPIPVMYNDIEAFLKLEIEKLEKLIEIESQEEEKQSISEEKKYDIKWVFSQNDFLELCKALKESGAVKGLQKDLIAGLSNLFQIQIENPDQQIQSFLKSRNNDAKTKCLDCLKEGLLDWYHRMDEKE